MKTTLNKTRWLVVVLLAILSATGAMAQNDDPTQEVCPGPSDYFVIPGNPANTFTWTVAPVTGWTIANNGNDYTVIITWDNVAIPTDYTVTLQEYNGDCYTEVSVLVTVNPQPDIPILAFVQPTCAVPTGTITVTSPIGANYEYSIDGTNYQASPIFSGLAPGTYNVTVINEFTCTNISAEVTINAVPNAPATPLADLIQPTCAVQSGTITVTDPLATDLEYSIDGTTWQASPVFAGLAPGTYTVSVRNTNDNTCESSADFTINAVPNAPATPLATITQPTCDEATGTITITAPLGADLEYSIDGGTTWQTTPVFGPLNSGTYTITVRSIIDPTCESSDDFVIDPQPASPATSPIWHN
jgi:hypothetical protein